MAYIQHSYFTYAENVLFIYLKCYDSFDNLRTWLPRTYFTLISGNCNGCLGKRERFCRYLLLGSEFKIVLLLVRISFSSMFVYSLFSKYN